VKLAVGAAVLALSALAGWFFVPQAPPPVPTAAVPAPAPARAVGEDWPTYHGGYSLDGLAAVAPPDQPERLWRTKIGRRIDHAPVVLGGRIFAAAPKGPIVALNLQGEQVWAADHAKDPVTTPLLAAEGLIIAGLQGGALVAHEAETGKEAWRIDLGGSLQGTPNRVLLPNGGKGIAVLSQNDGAVHVFELKTGKALWKTDPVERCDGSPGTDGGRLAFGSCASAMHVISLEKAAKAADVPLGGDNQVAGGVAISGGVAYAGTRSGAFFAVDLGGAKVLWTVSLQTKESFATPAVGEKLVVFGAQDGKVYALQRSNGAKAWDLDTNEVPTSPVIAGNRVVVCAMSDLQILELETGKRLASIKVADELTSPAVSNGVIYVGTDDGAVAAYGRK
jgi:outer membrane protein assembly factor BamB